MEIVEVEELVVENPRQPALALSRFSGRRNPWIFGLTIGLLAGLLAWLLGFTPWFLVVAALAALALALAQVTNLRVGISGALVLALAGYAVLVRWFPLTNLRLDVTGEIVLALAGAAAIFFIARQARSLPLVLPERRTAIAVAVLLGIALLITMVWLPWRTAQGEGPVWAMHNDATVQMIKARPIISNDGVNTAIQRNSSPLTSALIAMSMVVGRYGLDPSAVLQNDVTRAAQLWVLMIFTTCVLAALIAWRATRRASSMPVRVVASALVGIVPLTWYFAGFAISAGFYNSTLTLLILLASWQIWTESPHIPPVITVALLSLATVAMLATWAPVAVIPAALALLAVITPIWQGWRAGELSRALWLPLVVAALPIPLYAFLISLRDLGTETEAGAALAADGHIHQLPQTHVVWVLFIAALVVALAAISARKWHLLWGLGAIYLMTAVMMAFLFSQRRAAGTFLWGYYPIKAIWAVTSLVIVIGITCAIGYLSSRRHVPTTASVLGAILTVAVAGLLMWQMPPANWRYIFTPLDIVRGSNSAAFPWRANAIFDADVNGQATMLVQFEDRWDLDRFANVWLLQLLSTDGDDPIRNFAYLLDPTDDNQVCEAIRTWDSPWNRRPPSGTVTVVTSEPTLEQRLRGICPDADFNVVFSLTAPR